MKTVTFTAKEIRALGSLLWTNPCRGGCAFDEMQNSRKDCNKCQLTKALESIERKLGYYDE